MIQKVCLYIQSNNLGQSVESSLYSSLFFSCYQYFTLVVISYDHCKIKDICVAYHLA